MATYNVLPQLWLSAIDPWTASRQGTAAASDYMQMWALNNAAWGLVSQATGVFTLTTQFAMNGSEADLRQIFAYLNQHHILLDLAGQMLLSGPGVIGSGEGFGGPQIMVAAARRIAQLGGHLSSVVMDEPLYFGHDNAGPGAPQYSIQTVAQQVATSISAIRTVFPLVKVGDVEPFPATDEINQWITAFRSATGRQLDFMQADVQWGAADWQLALESLATTLRVARIPFGVIYDGGSSYTTAPQWLAEAVNRLAVVEADPKLRPDQVIFESWGDQPTNLLSEGTLGSLTNLALTYLTVEPFLRAQLPPIPSATPLTVQAPAGAWVIPNIPVSLGNLGIHLALGDPGAYRIVISCQSGILSGVRQGAGSISSPYPQFLVLTGGLADVQAELAASTYTAATMAGDTIGVAVVNYRGQFVTSLITVSPGTVAPIPTLAGASGGKELGTLEMRIAGLYEQVLGRSPDTPGLIGFTAQLINRKPLSEIRSEFAFSGEARQDIMNSYAGVYGRAASANELTMAQMQLAGGTPLTTVEAPLLADARAQVATLYPDVLGRDPDAAGLDHFSQWMLLGHPLATIRADFSASDEAGQRVNSLVEQYTGVTPSQTVVEGLEAWVGAGVSLQTLGSLISDYRQYGSVASLAEIAPRGGTAQMSYIFDSKVSEPLAATAGPDEFVFPVTTMGLSDISSFSTAEDLIRMPAGLFSSFTALQGAINDTTGGTLITFGGASSVFLDHIQSRDLGPINFAID